MEYMKIKRIVLLSIQKALLGMVYPEIRAIAVGFEGVQKLTVVYYLDREPNEEDYENISDVTAEVLGDINFSQVEENCIFSVDLLSNLDSLDSLVYMRKEN